ncbi:hypothetical protein A3J15_02650 [Candidatus Roizmanbacteria bacterium RIFCSPLOWO2_02_FULL_38_10]|uniref:Fervidolysin-like N-terminal prodomain domain-containing protein n=1 Tax=Candidatus Roizmanbacteria bacterium RIFCSPLOWO2_02_FULL_38_10 TaxID=1802074 RepID=A0A1F7JJY8_9BACT|nr:MAG: hypothetical protein A3J15_02650 [Candidatus Roizmanbacteria bacterium RIFCSPLOWO2_02_FULL_38_10]
MRRLLFFILFLVISFFLFNLNQVVAQEVPKAEYSPDEFIVKYKPGQSAQRLKLFVSERQKKARNFVNRMLIFLGDVKTKLINQKTPEEKWLRFESVYKTLGITGETSLNVETTSQGDQYVVKTDARLDILKVIAEYKKLPEVEYAEPNYIYGTFNLP